MTKAEDELKGRRNAKGEHRLPPAIAVILAGAAYAALPKSLLIGPRYVIPAIELLLLIALVATNPRRMTKETRWSREASIALSSLVIITNFVALGMLVEAMTQKGTPAGPLLIAAGQVWVTGVIGFGLLFWELDRGGPVARRVKTHADMQPADWRFSQDENHDAVAEVAVSASKNSGWIPTFPDYLYVSLTNSSAFSPTDTMPLTTRAKALMGLEATTALMISLLVIARAVGSLGG